MVGAVLRVAVWLVATSASSFTARAAPNDEPAAVEVPRREWDVVHCGFARGVLYLSYTEAGRAHVVPAFPTGPVLRACARAGHPVAASAPVRTPLAMAPITIGPPAMPPAPAGAASPRTESSISVQALGGSLTVQGRNDGDLPAHCRVDYAWHSDDLSTAQAGSAAFTLPPHQVQRITVPLGVGNARLVGHPRWSCTAAR